MKVPLLDLNAHLKPIEKDVKAAVNEVIDSTRYIMGPKVEELEAKVAEYVGAQYATGVSSGTDALLISLMALDIRPGDIVITTPFSFFATAGVIARLNATPVFVDIDPDTYNLSPDALRHWFEANKEKIDKVKAIIPVHLYGQCAGMSPILEIAGEHNIPVIEGAAQAIGARYPSKTGTKKAGAMGTMGCLSFFPSKNLGAMGDGGMVVTDDATLDEKLKKLRNHGAQPKYYHALIGGNFRLDPIQAAILLVKLPHLDKWHSMRQENAAYYDKSLNITGVNNPKIDYRREYHIYNQYVISVMEQRDDLRTFLTENEIGTEIYYPVPFNEQECFQYLGYKSGDFPNSEYAATHTIALPIYPELTTEMQDYVIEKIVRGKEEKMRSHHQLKVWQEAMALVKMIYTATSTFPKSEMYGLTSQMRRASVSIPSNIAEGAARTGTKEFLQFLSISRGSLSELETQIFIAKTLVILKMKVKYSNRLINFLALSEA